MCFQIESKCLSCVFQNSLAGSRRTHTVFSFCTEKYKHVFVLQTEGIKNLSPFQILLNHFDLLQPERPILQRPDQLIDKERSSTASDTSTALRTLDHL